MTALSSLVEAIESNFQTHSATVRIGGRRYTPLSIQVDNGFGVGAAQARIELSGEDAEALRLVGGSFGDIVEVDLGYSGLEVPVFRGYLENDSPGFWPQSNTVEASGIMKRTQYQYATEVTYPSQTDVAIIEDLLTRSGITSFSIEGPSGAETLTLGTVEDVVLKANTSPFDLIRRIDEIAGYITIDGPDGVVRRRPASGLPSASPVWVYIEGVNILDLDSPRTTRNLRNKVIVTGLPQGATTPSATQQADNALIPNPPQYIPLNYSNDLIETDAICSWVAVRLLKRENRVRREITLPVPGNPLLCPGMSTAIQSEKVDLPTLQPHLIKHVRHDWNSSNFTTRMVCEGGDGDGGYPITDRPAGGAMPEPIIEMVVTAEAWEVVGVPTRFYTVSCSGMSSYSPNREPGNLLYSWSNNKNADVSTTDRYGTYFTEAELPTAEITLEVTDADNADLSKSVTQAVDSPAVNIITRCIFVALNDVAQCSSDGGVTWDEFEAPFDDAVVRRYTICAETSRNGIGWFGATGSTGNGWGVVAHWLVAIDLGKSNDRDQVVHNFGSDAGCEITAIWVHEASEGRVIVGLANGEIWATSNALALELSRWELLVTLPDPIEWLIESFSGRGEIRACAGESVYVTFDGFANYAELVDFSGGTAYRQALSPFGNFASGDLAPDAVLNEDGSAITLPGAPPTDIRGLTHHIRRDVLWAGDRSGATYRKEEDVDTFTAVGTLTSGSPINHMIRDGDNASAIYLAADDGIYKSPNEADDWYQMISWNPVTYPDRQGLRVGYSDQPPPPADAAPECIFDFYIQEEFTGPSAGGFDTYRMRISRTGSGGAWQDEHPFANNGFWEVTLIALSDSPALFQGWTVHTVLAASDQNKGTLLAVDDSVVLDHTSGPAFDHWYLHLDDFVERLPQYAAFKVCPIGGAGGDVDTGSGGKAKLVVGSPPPNWYLSGHDDADWDPAIPLAGEPADAYTGEALIWRNDVVSPPAEEVLFRHAINPGLVTVSAASLYIRCNNSIQAIYFNGEFVGQVPASGDASGASDPWEFPLAPADVLPGEDNLLAIHAVNAASGGADTLAWITYKLTVTGE